MLEGFANGEGFIRGKLSLDLVLEGSLKLDHFQLLLGEGTDTLFNLLLKLIELAIGRYFELLDQAHIQQVIG